MKAVAFANNDMAIMAWTFGGKLPDCLGFAIYRIDVRAGTEICLPAMATFEGQDATDTKRTTADGCTPQLAAISLVRSTITLPRFCSI